MALATLQFEGTSQVGIISLICVCGFCNHHDYEKGAIEFNFKEKTIFYTCNKCNKRNEIKFGNTNDAAPLPRSRLV